MEKMQTLKMTKRFDSDILSLPIPKEMIGKNVEIILLVKPEYVSVKENREKEPDFRKSDPASFLTVITQKYLDIDDEADLSIEDIYRQREQSHA